VNYQRLTPRAESGVVPVVYRLRGTIDQFGVDMDWRKQELAGIGVLAASCAGAAWFLDMEFFTLVFMFASAFAGIAGFWRLMH
jgi:hypothetical protein